MEPLDSGETLKLKSCQLHIGHFKRTLWKILATLLRGHDDWCIHMSSICLSIIHLQLTVAEVFESSVADLDVRVNGREFTRVCMRYLVPGTQPHKHITLTTR